jgi:hypothetical protein
VLYNEQAKGSIGQFSNLFIFDSADFFTFPWLTSGVDLVVLWWVH